MQKLTFTNSKGDSIDLTSTPFGITEWDGFSNVEMEVQSQNVPFVDGSVYIDNLLDNRELSVTLAIEDNGNLKKRYELRREVIRLLNPKLGEGILRYKNNHLEKQIRCVAHTPDFENHNSNDEGTPKASLSFTACEPYWEDLEPTIVNFSLTEQPVVMNEGDCPTQVKLKISGQSTNARVTNVTTGAQVGITGLIQEPVDICTEFGKKSVTGSVMGWANIFGGTLKGIANKGEVAVVVGTDGAVLMSKNGIDWKSQISGTVENLNAVASNFNFNLFVAVGSDGIIIYSEDGKIWHPGSNAVAVELNSITCSNSRFVAVGENGVILTSVDGSAFTPVVSPVEEDLNDIIYDGETFVAVGKNGTIITSEDGLSWTVQTSGTSYTINAIAYDSNTGIYMAVGSEGLILTSSDSESWAIKAPLLYKSLNGVTYNDYTDEFVIIGDDGTLISGMNDLELKDIGSSKNLSCIYFVKEFGLMFVGGSGLLLRGANTDEWNKCLNITDSQLHDILYIKDFGLYIASGSDGQIVISENGETFESISIHINVNMFSLAYNSNEHTVIGVGTGGTIVRSFDGLSWEVVLDGVEPYTYYLKIDEDSYLLINEDGDRLIIATSEGAGALYSVHYSELKNMFVAVGDRGRIVTSSDGSNWTEQASGSEETLRAVTENEGLLVAVGDNGTVIYSSDGIFWQPAEINTTTNLRGVCASPTKTKFVAVGENGFILTSQNGINWRSFRTGRNETLNSVCYSGVYSQFLAVGNDGSIESSVDGQTWKGYVSGTNQNYEGVIFSDILSKYIAVGSRGTVMSSYISSTENLINMLSPNADINFNLDVGENILRVSCESGEPRVTIEFKNKYVGV